jgi:hypothetical protein
MSNMPFENFYYRGISIDLNINHSLENDYNDEVLNKFIKQINDIKTTIKKLLNESNMNNETYNLRKRIISQTNTETIKSDIINNYILYQSKLLEYHVRLDYLKTNCIKNNDYLLDWYNETKNKLNLVVIEYDKLKVMHETINKNYLQNENKLTNSYIEQTQKLDLLNKELCDIKIQRDFLKGINLKNKQIIMDLEKEINEKKDLLDKLNIENNKNYHQVQNYSYEIEKVLNDRKYIIDNNISLREEFNILRDDLDKTIIQLEKHKSKTENLKLEKEKLEKYIFKQNLEIDKNMHDMKILLENKNNEKNKILKQISEVLPDYIWDDTNGLVHKDYDIINETYN